MSPHLNIDMPLRESPAKASSNFASIPRNLGGLPDELLQRIVDSLSSQRDLWAVCLVNRRLNKVGDPLLYRSIAFDEPHHHITFSES